MNILQHHTRTILFGIVLSGMCIACAQDPSQNVPKAQVKDVSSQTSPVEKSNSSSASEKTSTPKSSSTLSPSAQKMALSGEIIFIGSKVTGSHTNRFKTWTGEVNLGSSLEEAKFKFTVQTASVEADYLNPKPWSEKLRKHFLSADFFDAQNHPTATFVSSSLKKQAGDQYQVTGTLTIRGQSKEISFPAKIKQDKGFNASTEFSINRKEYNIMYNGKADNLIRDGVVLKINLRTERL